MKEYNKKFYKDKEDITEYSMSSDRCIEDVLNDVASICLHQIMYNTSASAEMHKINIQSLKRVHRHLAKKFHCIYFSLVNNSINNYNIIPNSDSEYITYKATNLRNHLLHREELLESHIKTLGMLSREFFEMTGTINCDIMKMIKSIFRSLTKTRRAIERFNFTDWMPHDIQVWDYHLHKKMKNIEAEEDGYEI